MDLVRTRVLQIGDVVTVHRCVGAYTDLPAGLFEGAKVRVVRLDIGYADVIDEAGETFRVAFPQIDMPRSIWWRGQWVDRFTHPEGHEAWEWAVHGTGDVS